MNIKPEKGWILIHPMEAPTQTAGGILLPQGMQVVENRAAVEAVCEGCKLKKGQLVIYNAREKVEITTGPRKNLLIRETEILATYTE